MSAPAAGGSILREIQAPVRAELDRVPGELHDIMVEDLRCVVRALGG